MSAIWPLNVTLDTAILGDGALAAKLKGEKVYSLTAPANDDAMPYILLGGSIEIPRRLFGTKGYDGIETIDVWSADLTKFEAVDIANDLERILDMKALSVGGLHLCTGSFSVLAVTIDPSGKYSHASCRYEVLTFA